MTKFTKIISVMLAVILAVMAIPFTTSAATLGDVNDDGQITAVDARLILQVVAGLKKDTDLKNAAGADVDGKNGITAVDARIILRIVAGLQEAPTEPETPDTPSDPQKAEMAKLFNAKSAEIAKGTYNWTRNCDYVEPLTITKGGLSVDTIKPVVDKFLGVGTANGDEANAKDYGYEVIPMQLTEDDIKEVVFGSDTITIYLNNATNPEVGGNSSISHITKDIVTKADAEKEIKTAVKGATLDSFNAEYSDIVIQATLKDGNIVEKFYISYILNANLEANAIITVAGKGAVKTKITYNNIKY